MTVFHNVCKNNINKFASNPIKMSLTPAEEILRYSPIPPQTPAMTLSVSDFLKFF